MKSLIKSVEFAYPSSDTAAHFGFASQGCWVIQEGAGHGSMDAIKAFSERQDALRSASLRPSVWSVFFVGIHPTDAAQF